ncbi:MAG: PfkB family carbohydrate kinase [Woeseiaceae bacterium]|nr:PfkB family carbohydrate kinase [Woeseiaceae bacterium]
MGKHEVYAYGVVSSSTLYRIKGKFPQAQGYAEIEDVHHMTGGEATNSSIVLSRLGVSVKLDGNWLGADSSGERTRAILSDFGIDTSRLPLRKDYVGVQEVVVADADSRTIFGTYGRLLEKAEWNEPVADDIVGAAVVCLDPFFVEQATRAAKIAFDADVPVVTVDCKTDDELLSFTSAVVIAESFINEHYPDREVEDLIREYQAATDGLVVFTFGDAPVWFGRRGEAVRLVEPPTIDPVDTTGGGDAFRAGVVFGSLKGWDDQKTIRFSAALAALVCTRFPGVLDAPGLSEVVELMEGDAS